MTTLSRRSFLTTSALALSAAYGSMHVQLRAADLAWLAEVQTPPKELPPTAPKLAPLLVDRNGQPITTLNAWQARRQELRDEWLALLGSEHLKRLPAPQLEVLEEDRVEGVTRQRVRYEVEPDIFTEGYLLRPTAPPEKPRPGVAVFHSTVNDSILQPAGVKGEPNKAFGLHLAKAGYVTFSPRNYLWPVNDRLEAKQEAEKFLERMPKCKGMAKMLYDGQVALDILAAQSDVDPERLGAVGHSLGAKEVLYLAALDDRVKVTVSSEGGVGVSFSNWHDIWYLGPAVKEPSFKRDQHELVALCAPRAFLLIGGDSADGAQSWPYIEAALNVYKLHGGTPKLGLFNHRQGHSMPDVAVTRLVEWCQAWLA